MSKIVNRLSKREQRGVALVLVLGALTILTVMLTEFQDETSIELGSALYARDQLQAEYAAKSAVNLSRLLIAAEPTIRKVIAPLFMMMRQGPPQIPVWEFADQVLGAFNNADGQEKFTGLAGVDLAEGKNLDIGAASFEVKIVDEDSKINLNHSGNAIAENELGAQILGLLNGAQYDPMFENRDADGNFTDRQTICSALVDWVDRDEDAFPCDPHSGTQLAAAAEDSYYRLLKKPYERKNAPFDSLEEIRLVRGVGDDAWATFFDPDPDDPDRRTVTVWGQHKLNVNTANAQTLLAWICSNAPAAALCTDLEQAGMFLMIVNMVRSVSAGAPLFGSPRAFIRALKGKGMLGTVLASLQPPIQPVTFLSESRAMDSISTTSKVFSIVATGIVKAGKRETRTVIHAVVDFNTAPKIPTAPLPPTNAAGLGQLGPWAGNATVAPTPPPSNLPPGANWDDALQRLFQPDPAGTVLYFRID